jgi:hypothetical protein
MATMRAVQVSRPKAALEVAYRRMMSGKARFRVVLPMAGQG